MKKTILIVAGLAVLAAPALGHVITITSPAGGEYWVKGTTHTLTYSCSEALGHKMIKLFRNGSFLGYVFISNYPLEANVVQNYPWTVGKIEDDNGVAVPVACGGGYTLGFGLYGTTLSNPFTIGYDLSSVIKLKRIYYQVPPVPGGGCPQCLDLDLAALRQELVRLNEDVEAGLFLKGRQVASLGRLAKGQGLPAKQQVRLAADALEAVKLNEEFELRFAIGPERMSHAQAVRLQAVKPSDLRRREVR